MRLYKVTDREGYTRNRTIWRVGSVKAKAAWQRKPHLCSQDVYHAFWHPDVALLLLPNYVSFETITIAEPRGRLVHLFAVEGTPEVVDAVKVGSWKLKVTEEIALPAWYTDLPTRLVARALYAILILEQIWISHERPDERASLLEELRAQTAALCTPLRTLSKTYSAEDVFSDNVVRLCFRDIVDLLFQYAWVLQSREGNDLQTAAERSKWGNRALYRVQGQSSSLGEYQRKMIEELAREATNRALTLTASTHSEHA